MQGQENFDDNAHIVLKIPRCRFVGEKFFDVYECTKHGIFSSVYMLMDKSTSMGEIMPRAITRQSRRNELPRYHELSDNQEKIKYSKAGLGAFFSIMEKWGVKSGQAMILLGDPPRSTFQKWKRGDVHSPIERDRMTRVSYVLGIYKALQILYRDPYLSDRWIQAPNSYFGGRSALEHMLSGEIIDMATVRRRLDAVRGGWV